MAKPLNRLGTACLATLLSLLIGCSPSTPPATQTDSQESAAVDSTDSATDAIAPAPEAIALNQEDARKYLYDNAKRLGICEDNFDPEAAETESSLYQVGEKKYLVQLMCFMAAYQGAYEYLLLTQTPNGLEAQPLTLTRFEEDSTGKLQKTDARSIGGLTEYDPEKQLLTVFTKYRGIGDCGSLAQYKFSEDQLQLVEYKAKQECDGNYVEPDEYPQVYP
ncbi:MAG: DUF1176 domain-containing protein [Coleofasciculaceae cyanobacterium]